MHGGITGEKGYCPSTSGYRLQDAVFQEAEVPNPVEDDVVQQLDADTTPPPP
jgi:hypothetical protein